MSRSLSQLKTPQKHWHRCLDSIKNQDYENTEIIVVDNYSTDNTLEIAKRYTDNVYTVSPERSSQINYGVKKSSGKYIYRVDSDFLLERQIISEAVNSLNQIIMQQFLFTILQILLLVFGRR